jgi:hypothetical protein
MAPLLRRAYARTSRDMDDETIVREAVRGERLLWVIYEEDRPLPFLAVATTRVATFGTERICFIDALAGKGMSHWWRLLAEFEELARQQGVTRIQIEGRPGWARLLSGYSLARVVVEKKLWAEMQDRE